MERKEFSGRMEERSDKVNTQKGGHKQCEKLQRSNIAMQCITCSNFSGKVERRDRGERKPA